jgi:hypothetical protein
MKVVQILALLATTVMARRHIVVAPGVKESGAATGSTTHPRNFRRVNDKRPNYHLSTWQESTDEVIFDVSDGKIFHSSSGIASDITSIAAIKVPSWAGSNMCTIKFELADDSTIAPETSQFLMQFTNAALPSSDGPWSAETHREGSPVGPYEPHCPGEATGGGPMQFPCCDHLGQWIGVELRPYAGLGGAEAVDIEWDDELGGPYLYIS